MTEVAIVGGCGHMGLTLGLALAHSGERVVAVTHNMAFVQKVDPKAFWLETKKVRQIGDPREVVEYYRRPLRRR